MNFIFTEHLIPNPQALLSGSFRGLLARRTGFCHGADRCCVLRTGFRSNPIETRCNTIMNGGAPTNIEVAQRGIAPIPEHCDPLVAEAEVPRHFGRFGASI